MVDLSITRVANSSHRPELKGLYPLLGHGYS